MRGEKKKDVVTSLMPNVAASPAKSGGWLTSGMMMRVIMFQSELSSNGMTGWTLRMNRVSSEGPTFCSQLNWNGTLTRSEIGFDSFLASSALSAAAAGAAACWAYPIEDVTSEEADGCHGPYEMMIHRFYCPICDSGIQGSMWLKRG